MLIECSYVIVSFVVFLACFDFFKSVQTYRNINKNSDRNLVRQTRSKMWPTEIALSHCLKFMGQKINYEIHGIAALFYVASLRIKMWLKMGKTHASADDVVNFLLNTSFVVLLTPEEKPESIDNANVSTDAVRYKLILDKFKWPLFLSVDHCNCLKVIIELPNQPTGEQTTAKVTGAKVIAFTVNDAVVTSYEAQLAILTLLISWVVHPHIHSYNNIVYNQRRHPNAHKYDDLFLHGQYLNCIAHVYPAYLNDIAPRVSFDAICFNKSLQIPLDSLDSLHQIAKYSRYVRFALHAQKAMEDIHEKYKLPGKPHDLFITSIWHSIDHYSVWAHVKGIYLNLEGLPVEYHPYCNLFAAIFVAPCQYVFKNLLKSKQNKTMAYKELYQGLESIDKEFADNVTLSISY